jgi:hypothetical protein
MTQPLHQSYDRPEADEGGGWIAFAAVMFLLAAVFNAVYGIAALANDDYFTADELLFGDLTMWGWIYLAFAAAQLIATLLLIGRRTSGALLGIAIVLVHGTAVLLSIGAYPIWSVILLVIDGFILYGLSVYGLGSSEA